MLLIPEELRNLINNYEKKIFETILEKYFEDSPKKPLSPTYKSAPYEPYLSIENKYAAKRSLYIFLVFLCFFIGLSWLNYDPRDRYSNPAGIFLSGIFYGIPALIYLYSTILSYYKYLKDKQNHTEKYQEYLTESKNHIQFLKDYENKMKLFEKENKTYENQLSEYEKRKIEFINSDLFKEKFEENKTTIIGSSLAEYSKNILLPQKTDLEFKVGLSERYFNKFLNKYFSEITILKHYILEFYEPDFILSLKNGLFIDLEIDEPYSLETKKITHYYDRKKEKFSDSSRNEYFLKNNWIVIRFAEQQIIEQPVACCKYIARVIQYLLMEDELESFEGVEELIPEHIWSKVEASEMAYFDFRKNYLTEDFVKKEIKNWN